MEPVIEADKLCRKFGTVAASDSISLSVAQGELFGLLGPNGSGKTTLIKLLTGQIQPDSGSARVMGVNAAREPVRVRELVGIIPEQETPPSFLTSEEYLFFVAKVRKLDRIRERCDRWFSYLMFGEKRHVMSKDLSRGTRQKLMFAQAFLHEPKVAFIDEPLINLDPLIQKKVKDFLLDYVKKGGTVFFSTHVLEIAQEICTRIAILDNGRIIHESGRKEITRKRDSLERIFLSAVGGRDA